MLKPRFFQNDDTNEKIVFFVLDTLFPVSNTNPILKQPILSQLQRRITKIIYVAHWTFSLPFLLPQIYPPLNIVFGRVYLDRVNQEGKKDFSERQLS